MPCHFGVGWDDEGEGGVEQVLCEKSYPSPALLSLDGASRWCNWERRGLGLEIGRILDHEIHNLAIMYRAGLKSGP